MKTKWKWDFWYYWKYLLDFCITDKLEAFTNYKVKFRYFLKTRKVRSHFEFKDSGHTVNWEILTNALKQVYKRKLSEAFTIEHFNSIVGRGFLTPTILWRPPSYNASPPPLFKCFPNPSPLTPPTVFVALFLWLNVWSGQTNVCWTYTCWDLIP